MMGKRKVSVKLSLPLYIAAITLVLLGVFVVHPEKNRDKESVAGIETKQENSSSEKVRIVKVVDGDTVGLSNGRTLRYIGINTPERGDPYFDIAQTANEKLSLNQDIEIEYDIMQTDQYGRDLGYVFADGVFINEALVQEGVAVIETIPPNVKYQNRLLEAQEFARFQCWGIWEGLCKNTNGSCLIIDTILYDPPGDDNQNKNEEWIRIKNNCEGQISIENFLIKDSSANNRYVFNSVLLQPTQIVTIHSGCGQDTERDRYWQCPEGRSSIWNNDGDHAYLYNPAGLLVDDFEY